MASQRTPGKNRCLLAMGMTLRKLVRVLFMADEMQVLAGGCTIMIKHGSQSNFTYVSSVCYASVMLMLYCALVMYHRLIAHIIMFTII